MRDTSWHWLAHCHVSNDLWWRARGVAQRIAAGLAGEGARLIKSTYAQLVDTISKIVAPNRICDHEKLELHTVE